MGRGGNALTSLRAAAPAAPLALFFLATFAAPFMALILISLFDDPSFAAMGLAQYARFFGDAFNLVVLLDTILLGLMVTGLCLLLAYPLGMVYVAAGRRLRTVILFLILLPMLTSAVVRTFAWIAILGRQGVVNTLLLQTGLWEEPIRMLYTWPGLVVALAQIQLPLMALPVINSLLRIDPNLGLAAEGLGAGRLRVFLTVTLPLSLPGAVAGGLLVFAAAVTAFITQSLVGGGRIVLMPLYIYQQSVGVQDWPFAAAISVVFTVSVVALVALANRAAQSRMGGVDGA